MMKVSSRVSACLEILGAGIGWGCSGLFTRPLLNAGMGIGTVAAVRNTGCMLLLLMIFSLKDRSVFRIRLRHLPIFFGTGVMSILVVTILYYRCQALCSLAVSAILLYTAPAIVVLLSAVIFREKITKIKLMALALALLGCSFVTGIWSGNLNITSQGLVTGLCAGFFYALYSIFSRFALAAHDSTLTIVVWSFLFSGSFSLFFMDLPILLTTLPQPKILLSSACLICISTLLPYLLYTKGLESVESGKAAILTSIEPVAAAFVGILAYGESLTLSVCMGLGCILLCILILQGDSDPADCKDTHRRNGSCS